MKLFEYKIGNNKEIPVLKLDLAGLAEYKKKLADKQEELINVQTEKRKALAHAETEWNGSNLNYSDTILEYEIKRLKDIIANAIIIENNTSIDEKTIKIGDAVEVELIFSEDDKERMILRLGSEHQINTDDGIDVISINSELGEALYNSKVGTTVKFGENKKFIAEIVKKIDENVKDNLEKNKQNVKKA